MQHLLNSSNFSSEYWIFFFVLVAIFSLLDAYLITGTKTTGSISSTVFWMTNAIITAFILQYLPMSQDHGIDFFIAYLIELSLSIDNIFVFMMIFERMQTTHSMQRRILHIGIASAIIMRLIMILFGLNIVQQFHWVFYIFGFLLILGAGKMLFTMKSCVHERVRRSWYSKFFSDDKTGVQLFFTKHSTGKIMPTVNLLTLILIEKADIVFAIDSIPAVMSITTDAFIIFSSNILAVAGLRSLFFVVSSFAQKFTYLRYGVVFILVFIGIKLALIPQAIIIPKEISCSVILIVITISVIASMCTTNRKSTADDT